MRKTNLGSRMVKKAITWAMIMTMSLSAAMSNAATMTAYAKPSESHKEHREDFGDKEHKKDFEDKNNDEENKEEQNDNAQQESASTETELEVEVTETTEKSEEIYLDGEMVVDNEETEENEIEEVQNNNELDYTKVETTVTNVETHYVIENTETDEAIVGTTADGETVEKIEVNAEDLEVKEVLVIEKETQSQQPATEDTGKADEEVAAEAAIVEISENDVVYGYFEDGAFIEGSVDDGKSQAYTETDGTYKETTTVNKVSGIDSETGEAKDYYVNNEVVDVLNGEEVDGYEKKTVYYVGEGENKKEIQEEELESTLAGTDYEVDEETGVLTVKATENVTATIEYQTKKGTKQLDVTGTEVSSDQIKKNKNGTYTVTIDGTDYTVVSAQVNKEVTTTYVSKRGGNTISEEEYKNLSKKERKGYEEQTSVSYSLNTQESKSYSIMVDGQKVDVAAEDVESKTIYQVIDSEGNMLCEVDATTVENIADCIETKNYTKVNEMYVVKNEENKDVYFTPQEWEMVVSQEVTYQEVTEYYYVSEDNYENEEIEITSDDKDYLLDVDFWNSEYVKLDGDANTAISYAEDENGNIVVTVKYLYTEDFEVNADSVWKSGVYTKTISKEEFGISRIATLTVKYTPTLTKTESVAFDAVLKVEETTQKQEGDAITTSSVVANNGEPVNEKPVKNKTYNHVDVLTDTKVSVDGKEVDAKVSGVTVTVGDRNITMSQHATTDPQRYTEYRSTNSRNLGISNNDYVTITAKVTYTYNGQEYTFDYVVKVYPNNDEHNHCQDAHKDGFDYQITSTELQAAIKEDIVKRSYNVVIEEGRTTTESGSLGDAAEDIEKTEVTAKVFVRIDNEQQVENGSTHYASADYTKDLASKYNKPIYLAYTKEGYAVHDENVPEDSTAAEEINKKLGNSESVNSVERLKALADLYMQNDKVEQLSTYVESDEFKDKLAQEVAQQQGENKEDYNWTYQVGTKTYDSYEEAFKAAQELTVTLTMSNGNGVNWYVLKIESDGWHIDGVSKIATAGIKAIKGQPIPTATPSAEPTQEPSAEPTQEPSAEPTQAPSAEPTAMPSAEPTQTPSAEPTQEPVVSTEEVEDETPDDVDPAPMVIIEDEPVALAAAPAAEAPAAPIAEVAAPVADEAVLGAVRERDAAVLGAMRATDYAVLGKRRRPETGDGISLALWAVSTLTATGAAGISGMKLAKGKKKNNKRQ